MNQISDFFKKLFDTSDWPPRWHCGTWTDFHGWLYIISDLLIWSAYFAIPVIILSYISKRNDVRFHKIYFLFAGFILWCGLTHLIDVIIFWKPVYRLSALTKLITGIISWVTVIYLIRLLPHAFSLRSPQALEAEIEQRKMAEEELKIKNKQLNEAQEIAKIGHWEWDIISNKISWSDGIYRVFGIHPLQEELSYQKYLEKIHPEDKVYVDTIVQNALQKKQFPEFHHRIIHPNGQIKIVRGKGEVVLNKKQEVIKMIGTAQDVTKEKEIEEKLRTKSKELETTNAELKKFAYVASHDLQEPLRKIMTFTSLLEKDYSESIGEKGKMYMEKLTNSSLRMQQLINDILYFSKVTAQTDSFVKTDLNVVLKQVLTDMEVDIEKTGAKIQIDQLPTIESHPSQMGQLFQNILSNSLKFKKENTLPEIHIYAEIIGTKYTAHAELKHADLTIEKEHGQLCKIYVKDNGIGFEEIYLDRIFELFQQLHNKTIYKGTGIGLAICKKIVQNHSGNITAKSKPQEGATFIITIPISQKND